MARLRLETGHDPIYNIARIIPPSTNLPKFLLLVIAIKLRCACFA